MKPTLNSTGGKTMKIGKKRGGTGTATLTSSRPAANQSKKTLLVIAVIAVTALLMVWTFSMAKKAEETVTIARLTTSVYKNQLITESMFEPYDMLKGEFEKYATVEQDGTVQRRVFTWDEIGMVYGSYAAYPLQEGKYAERRDFYTSKIDNSDSVMYNFPGKEIVSLGIAEADLNSFKTFLQPGDRVNITATYMEEETVATTDSFGVAVEETVETFKTETVFEDIIIADLLNNSGESILDIYSNYNDRTVSQQAALDASTSFQNSVKPTTMLVALTTEEKELYYYYLSKDSVTFRMSLPQRIE